jgi:hypothetical protein
MTALAFDLDRLTFFADDDDIDDDEDSDFDTDEDNDDSDDDEDDESDEDDVETWQVHAVARISAKARPWLDFQS